MACKFRKTVPGDSHIECTRNFQEGDLIPYPFAKALSDLPRHAGVYPVCFNDAYVCRACPEYAKGA
jgi:hypothetical protein